MIPSKLYIYAFVGLGVAGVIFFQVWKIGNLEKDIKVLNANNSKLEYATQLQNQALETTKNQLSLILKQSLKLQNDIQKIRIDSDLKKEKLNDFRKNLKNVSLKKPSLIELRANRAFNQLMHQFNERN